MIESLMCIILSPLSPMWASAPILLSLVGGSFTALISETSSMPLQTPLFLFDAISCPLITLTIWIFPLTFLSSWNINNNNSSPSTYYILAFSLLLILISTFSCSSLISFYILFELSLIPILSIILIWGYQPERLSSSLYIIIYTISASLPLLVSITQFQSYNYAFSMSFYFTNTVWFISYATLAAFLVNLPIYSLHLWLPNAHTEASVAGSIILASILLNLGAYGLLRITTIIPSLSSPLQLSLLSLSLIGAAITTFMCLRQHDINELIAYASVSHISLIAASILTNSHWATLAIIIINIGHGLTSSLLFSLTNVLYENTHTRAIALTNGIQTLTPFTSIWILIALLANGGAPPFINLLSEISIFIPLLHLSLIMLLLLFTISFISIVYSLFIFINIGHGNPSPHNLSLSESTFHALSSSLHVAPLIILILISQFLI